MRLYHADEETSTESTEIDFSMLIIDQSQLFTLLINKSRSEVEPEFSATGSSN